MNANRHQKITPSLAASLVVRAVIQSARQTSQLHRMARANSSPAGAFIFAAATLCSSGAPSPSSAPPPPATKISASSTAPARLPSQDSVQLAARSPPATRRRSRPIDMNMVCPVNSSEPAKTTSVSAMPNEAPITSRRQAGSMVAPTLKIRMMPSPT